MERNGGRLSAVTTRRSVAPRPEWRGQADGCVFTASLGEPIYSDTLSRLMLDHDCSGRSCRALTAHWRPVDVVPCQVSDEDRS